MNHLIQRAYASSNLLNGTMARRLTSRWNIKHLKTFILLVLTNYKTSYRLITYRLLVRKGANHYLNYSKSWSKEIGSPYLYRNNNQGKYMKNKLVLFLAATLGFAQCSVSASSKATCPNQSVKSLSQQNGNLYYNGKRVSPQAVELWLQENNSATAGSGQKKLVYREVFDHCLGHPADSHSLMDYLDRHSNSVIWYSFEEWMNEVTNKLKDSARGWCRGYKKPFAAYRQALQSKIADDGPRTTKPRTKSRDHSGDDSGHASGDDSGDHSGHASGDDSGHASGGGNDSSCARLISRVGIRVVRDMLFVAIISNLIAELARNRNIILDGLNKNKKLAAKKKFIWLRKGKKIPACALRVLISLVQAGCLIGLNAKIFQILVKCIDGKPRGQLFSQRAAMPA
jgi:hypothetical protein